MKPLKIIVVGKSKYYTKSKHDIYLYFDKRDCKNISGVKPVFYKKVKGAKNFKKISLQKYKKSIWRDKNVKPGKTYYYKAKAMVTKHKKKYYSRFTKKVKAICSNYSAEYKLETLTPSGIYKNVDSLYVIFKLTSSNKNNGKTIIYNSEYAQNSFDYAVYETSNNTDANNNHFYTISITKYSLDNKNWKTIPKKGISLSKKESIYIKGTVHYQYGGDKDQEAKTIYFAGNDTEFYSAVMTAEHSMFKYIGPVGGKTTVRFNLKKGIGNSKQVFDW